jgi:tartrate/fumarate subfamily iron-sulfur-dependent hydro-lyase alpha chain
MITRKVMEAALFSTIKKSACEISPDIQAAFEKAMEKEEAERPKKAFEATLQSMQQSKKIQNLLCPDTGWPLFFCKVGNEAKIEGSITGFEEIAKRMVAKATREGYLRSTMKHPLTGDDPGTNVGTNVPGFTYKFVPGDFLQITYVAKGGGSECFGGTRYRVVAFADGITGIKKAVIDWYIAAARAGAICPPSVLGVGIGGTADIATHLAKQAATLRLIGSRHPEPMIAELEERLTTAINKLGIGPMGSGGNVSVYTVNVEYSLTHLAGIAVAMSANCWVARRATTRIHSDGRTEEMDNPQWFNGR